jgi:hypothetical protein
MSTSESIGESPCGARGFTDRRANRSSWGDVLLLSIFVAVPAALIMLAGYTTAARNHPTDEELTESFRSHESAFQSLVQVLDTDRGRLLSLGGDSYEFTDLVAADAGTPHLKDYKDILARIGSANFRYFPRSGNLILPASRSGDNIADTTKAYLYLSRGEPQPLLRHQSVSWRGPGIYFFTGDRRIKGRWFIHHEGTWVVAFAPY